MTKYLVLAGIFCACFCSQTAQAFIGDPAPALTMTNWLKGQPVEIKAGTNVYVVELWQTAAPYSREFVTNATLLQNKFQAQGVIVVAISDEPEAKVSKFLQDHGANISFRLALDDHDRTFVNYMRPAEQHVLPYAFVINTNGVVWWDGVATAALNDVVRRIASGSFDLPRQQELEVAAHQMNQYFTLVQKRDPRLVGASRSLLANRTNDVELLCDMAVQITLARGLSRDFRLADAALRQAEAIATTNADRVAFARALWLFETGHPEPALAKARQAADAASNAEDKAFIQSGLQSLEARWAAIKARQTETNAVAPVTPTNRLDHAKNSQPNEPQPAPATQP